MQVAIGTGEVVDFQPLDLLLDRRRSGQQRRHGDDRAQMRGHAVGELQGWQEMGVEAEADGAIDQRNRRVYGGDHAKGRQNAKRQGVKAGRVERDKGGGEKAQGDSADRADIEAELLKHDAAAPAIFGRAGGIRSRSRTPGGRPR